MKDDLARDALHQRVQGLPKTLQPDSNLWERIEANLDEPNAAEQPAPVLAPGFGWPVAAVALLGVALALLALNFPGEQPIAQSQPQEPLIQVGQQSQMQIQMHQLLDAQLADLPAEVRSTVVKNLAIISAAREEIRQALDDNPDNALLHSLYRNSYANERTLLKDVEAMARQSKRRTQL